MSKEESGGGEGGAEAGEPPKVRTPHKDVGENDPTIDMEWIADTQDLISASLLADIPVNMIAASGRNYADKQCKVRIPSISTTAEPYVLPDSPSVLSVRQKRMEEGFDFIWRANCRPYFIPQKIGKKTLYGVKNVTRNKLVRFNPKNYRCVVPWKGDRRSITGCVNRAVPCDEITKLRSSGFSVSKRAAIPAPVSDPEDERVLEDLVTSDSAPRPSEPRAKPKVKIIDPDETTEKKKKGGSLRISSLAPRKQRRSSASFLKTSKSRAKIRLRRKMIWSASAR